MEVKMLSVVLRPHSRWFAYQPTVVPGAEALIGFIKNKEILTDYQPVPCLPDEVLDPARVISSVFDRDENGNPFVSGRVLRSWFCALSRTKKHDASIQDLTEAKIDGKLADKLYKGFFSSPERVVFEVEKDAPVVETIVLRYDADREDVAPVWHRLETIKDACLVFEISLLSWVSLAASTVKELLTVGNGLGLFRLGSPRANRFDVEAVWDGPIAERPAGLRKKKRVSVAGGSRRRR